MKAIEIIQAMCYDSALAEHSQVVTFHGNATEEDWMAMMFGNFRIKEGFLEPSDYLVTWQCDNDCIYPFSVENCPDCVLERINPENYQDDDREVYLYSIE